MVPSVAFIPIAKESGQIIEIGAWVVRTACAQHLARCEAGMLPIPVDKLKIDRAFVANITDNPGDAALANGIIVLAKSLCMGFVAEGVETEEQLALLCRHGCEEIQGYYYSRPLPAAELEAWLLRESGNERS